MSPSEVSTPRSERANIIPNLNIEAGIKFLSDPAAQARTQRRNFTSAPSFGFGVRSVRNAEKNEDFKYES